MKRLIESLVPFDSSSSGYTVEDWNAAVRQEFGSFLSAGRLEETRELLRTELVNLARIHDRPQLRLLLRWTFDLFNRAAGVNYPALVDLLAEALPATLEAQQKYLSALLSGQVVESTSLYDVVQARFAVIDLLLEGALKPYFTLAHSAATLVTGGSVPARRVDFGQLVESFPSAIRTADADPLFVDAAFKIKISQWRNIAAHRTFRVAAVDKIDVWYGLSVPPQRLTLTPTDLEDLVAWVDGTLTAVRLATTLIFLEHMPAVVSRLSGPPAMRLEQWLVTLFHNLALVGFPVASITDAPPAFGVHVRFNADRPVPEALAHASQALQQLGCALESDELRSGRYTTVGIELVADDNAAVTAAVLAIADAVAYSEGIFDDAELANRVRFGRSLKPVA